jgi:putative exosortase-associated protein (TIGR04073 family)
MKIRNIAAAAVSISFILSVVVPSSYAESVSATPASDQQIQELQKAKKCGVSNDRAWKKLGRGVCNLATFPFELTNQIGRTNNSDGAMAALTWGIIKGVGMTGFRALVGAYEVVTFPFPIPGNYDPILTDPEFFFDGELCLY